MPYKDPEVQKAYDRAKYQRNREKRLRQVREYAQKHKAEIAEYKREYDQDHRDELNDYLRDWRKSKRSEQSFAKERETARKWCEANPEKRKATYDRYIVKHREKFLAHHALQSAIKSGRVVKPKTCSMCGAGGRIHGHHPNYSETLEVVWVCHGCHLKIHGGSFNS